jgi:Arc/MetJ family transcription regulator
MANQPTRINARIDARVSRTVRLSPQKLADAQRVLGTSTVSETIDTALDAVVFRRELLDGTRALFGVHIASPDAV